jgi:hypothetical protein
MVPLVGQLVRKVRETSYMWERRGYHRVKRTEPVYVYGAPGLIPRNLRLGTYS